MTEDQLKALAQQLRKPEGDYGIITGEFMNKGNQRMNMDAIRALAPDPDDQILEIGMGNGLFVNEIVSLHPTIKYTGCDYSSLMVIEAEKINKTWIEKEQAQFICSNAEQIPLSDNSFNKLFTINTLYFWETPAKTLKEFKRLLKPNAELIIVIRPKRLMNQFAFTKFGFTTYSEEDVIELLSENGFEVTKTIESPEPDTEINGILYKMENLIVSAVNNK